MNTCHVKEIYQLCIRRLAEDKYNFNFIYLMTDETYNHYEQELTGEQAARYFDSHDWNPDRLPWKDGQTVHPVAAGKLNDTFANGKELNQ